MSESPTPPSTSIKRYRIGFNVVLQIVLSIVIVGAINFLSCRKYAQWDHTPTKQYSLGQQSDQILGGLVTDVRLTVIIGRDSDAYTYITRMLPLYEKAAKGRLTYRLVDPIRDPTAIAELRNSDANLYLEDGMILVDAEGGARQVVKDKEMFDRDTSTFLSEGTYSRGRILKYRLESALTSAVLAATQNRQQVVYLVADKGGFRPTAKGDAGGVLLDQGKKRQNMLVKPLFIKPDVPIPADASAVVVLAPKTDFTGDELKRLFRDYWDMRRGGLILLMDPVYHDALPNLLKTVENRCGVRIADDRILSLQSRGGTNQRVLEVPVHFLPGSSVTEDLLNKGAILPGQTSSVDEVGQADDGLVPRDLRVTGLMVALADYWKETDYKNTTSVIMNPEKGEDVNVFTAMAVEKGAGINPQLRIDSSRMVVSGNGSLLDPDNYSEEWMTFVLNSINWVSDRDELIVGIEEKEAQQHRVSVTDAQFKRLESLTLRIFPGSVFLFGLLVAYLRRR